MVILMGLWLIIQAESKPLPSLQHVIEIEESFLSTCEKPSESERCLGDDGDVIMVIGEEFNLSSTRSFQCGSNEVLQCVVLSEIILTLLCHVLRIIGNRKEIIELRSGFRFEGETSECLHSGLHRILDIENWFFITHRLQSG